MDYQTRDLVIQCRQYGISMSITIVGTCEYTNVIAYQLLLIQVKTPTIPSRQPVSVFVKLPL